MSIFPPCNTEAHEVRRDLVWEGWGGKQPNSHEHSMQEGYVPLGLSYSVDIRAGEKLNYKQLESHLCDILHPIPQVLPFP